MGVFNNFRRHPMDLNMRLGRRVMSDMHGATWLGPRSPVTCYELNFRKMIKHLITFNINQSAMLKRRLLVECSIKYIVSTLKSQYNPNKNHQKTKYWPSSSRVHIGADSQLHTQAMVSQFDCYIRVYTMWLHTPTLGWPCSRYGACPWMSRGPFYSNNI